MSSISSIKFLGGVGQHSNLEEIDIVLEEILKTKTPKEKEVPQENDEENMSKNLNDESFTSIDESAGDDKPRALCSMPYTKENRAGAFVAALEFARRSKANALFNLSSTYPPPLPTSATERGWAETELPSHAGHI